MSAGQFDQLTGAIAIGDQAATGAAGQVLNQKADSICIGRRAGFPLGVAVAVPPNSILIGAECAPPASADNKLCINGTLATVATVTAGGLDTRRWRSGLGLAASGRGEAILSLRRGRHQVEIGRSGSCSVAPGLTGDPRRARKEAVARSATDRRMLAP